MRCTGSWGRTVSGKSTTIRVLLGLLRADSGAVRLLGGDPWREAATLHRRLAYVPGDVNLWPNLTGGEIIDLLGRLRGRLDPNRRAALIETFELDPTKKGRAYSKGNRQKVALVAALASDAELLLLDEPTSGLDPIMEAVSRTASRSTARNGGTVLLSSHILAEVESLCDRVSILRAGRVVESGTLADLRHLTRTSIVAELDRTAGRPRRAIAGVHDLDVQGSRATFEVDTAAPRRLLEACSAARRTQPHQHAADPRGVVPAPLRRRGAGGGIRRRRTGMSGLGAFLRTFARRDRWLVLGFVVGVTLLYWSQAPSVHGLYPTRQAFEEAAAMMGSNPAFVAMAGPARALDTTGGQVAWQSTAFGAIVAGLVSMALIGRHTRAEEESGRDELLRASAVSRRTPMTAAVSITVAANVLAGTVWPRA